MVVRPPVPERIKQLKPLVLAREQVVAVADELSALFPAGGLRRGSSIAISAGPGGGSRTLTAGLLANATATGSWAAVVGVPGWNLAAAAEQGVSLERIAIVDRPEPASWATVVAALIGACDVVVAAPPPRVRAALVARVQARARERGSVLMITGGNATASAGLVRQADVHLKIESRTWRGLGVGHGHLRAAQATVEVTGRRQAARPRRFDLWLPGPDGRVGVVSTVADAGRGHDTAAARDAGPRTRRLRSVG
ncbi:MAG: hypothetical protein HKN26_15845 [Acidimicrobiales bacterium]|nr:hypothetical protein [Acidimicrobiales bacterium]